MAIYQCLLLLSPLRLYTVSWPQSRGSCEWGMWNSGFAHGPVVRICMWSSTSSYGCTSWWSPQSSQQELCSFNALQESYLPLSQSPPFPQFWSTQFSTMDAARVKWVSRQYSTQLGKLVTHSLSLFSPWEKSQVFLSPMMCHLGGELMWAKLSCSFYLLQHSQTICFFVCLFIPQWIDGCSLLEIWTSQSLFHPLVTAQFNVIQVLFYHSQIGMEQVYRLLQNKHPATGSFCLLPDT